jgi:trehalose/maltose hydrolase-like predicted phosphorylase
MVPGDREQDQADVALAALNRARGVGWRGCLAAHSLAWGQRWDLSDIEVDGNEEAQKALRFAIYHLNGAANPDNERVSIGARALTGEAYLGHVFWDTEIFLLPFYIFTWPAAARAMLMYRYHTLGAARAKASDMGYRGALYAWESAADGEETTPPYVIGRNGQEIIVKNGEMEQHISADVAFAVWQYWEATGDDSFMLDAGAEIILETGRFWASRAEPRADGYHIPHVIGPDEYHEDVDDNAYTNGLAQWNIDRAIQIGGLLEARYPERWWALRESLNVTESEVAEWGRVARGLVTGIDPNSGLIEQFAGFFDLDPFFVAGTPARSAPIDVMLGPERTRRSQVIKQADVVMLLHLLWDRFSPQVREANFRYYEARCGHGSSLSTVIHAAVAARLGDTNLAERYFEQSAAIDIEDAMGNSSLGVHIATLGGMWQVAVLGFAGMSMRDDGLSFEPRLPDSWPGLRFPVQWRGRLVRVAIQNQPRRFTASIEDGEPLSVSLNGLTHQLDGGTPWTCQWDENSRSWVDISQ